MKEIMHIELFLVFSLFFDRSQLDSTSAHRQKKIIYEERTLIESFLKIVFKNIEILQKMLYEREY